MSAGDYWAWVLVTLAVFSYIAPSIVAICREVPNRGSVIVVNLLLGWSVVGWVVALAMAVRTRVVAVRNAELLP